MKKVRWGVLSTSRIGVGKVIPAMKRGRLTEVAPCRGPAPGTRPPAVATESGIAGDPGRQCEVARHILLQLSLDAPQAGDLLLNIGQQSLCLGGGEVEHPCLVRLERLERLDGCGQQRLGLA